MQQTNKFSMKSIFKPLFFLILILYATTAFSQSGVSLSWNVSVGCQTFENEEIRGEKEPISIEDIADNICIRVCEGSFVTYTLSGDLGAMPGTQWTVVGGTINSQTNTQCVVSWGTAGNGSMSFLLNTPNGLVTKTICFEKIIKPTAHFNVLPAVSVDKDIYSCIDQEIFFTNQSTANNGTEIIYYFWSFGDGEYSSEFEPSHTYTQDGEYTVTLIVRNNCNCTAKYSRNIIVKERGFDIECPTVVCEGQEAVYSLPFEGREICRDNFNWSVIGGQITNVDSHTGDVTVLWNHVDDDGFGYVTFDPRNCRVRCLFPTTIKVPVVKIVGTIKGDATLCVKEQGIYRLPQWPTTDIHWEIDGNEDGSLADVILTDQRNQVVIRPLVPGNLILRATYQNTLLRCGGTAFFAINVSQGVHIIGSASVCQNTTAIYHTEGGVVTSWTLKNNSGTTISTLAASDTFSYNFTTIGNYILAAGSSGSCPGMSQTITVMPTPTTPNATSLTGELLVCPNAPYVYSMPNDPTAQYHWSATNGIIVGSDTGNQVSIKFTGTTPASITIYKEVFAPASCNSASITIPVTIKQVNAEIATDETIFCANSSKIYKANNTGLPTLYTEGETYTWSISPSLLGSVTTGQGTNQIGILWNNVNTLTTATVTLVIQKCTITKTITKTIQLKPIAHLVLTTLTPSVCSGTPISFTLSTDNGVTLDPLTVVTWNFGFGDTTGGLIQSYPYTNTTNANNGYNVTAYVTNPNGCTGISNTANVGVTILPAPPAAASLSTQFNTFCTVPEINATLSVASATSGVAIQWYNGVTLLAGETGLTLNVTPATGFGAYTFTATNANLCVTRSNPVYIMQNCGPITCTYSPTPTLTNTSSQSCGVITLAGTASGSPVTQYWKILGPPNVNLGNYTGTTLTATEAGEFHIYKTAGYLNSNNEVCLFTEYKLVTVPYIPDFSYAATCNGSNFDVSFTDKSNFFYAVTNRSVTYYYKLQSSGTFIGPVSSLSGISGGAYDLKIVISGTYGSPQPPCEKTIQMVLATVANQNIIVAPLGAIPCHDTNVTFTLSGIPADGDSYLWTFEPGAENTILSPSRVFTTTGIHDVQVVITNKYGCSSTLHTTVNIPVKCFGGNVFSTPSNASVCLGTPVTVEYVPNADNCPVAQYIWMNGSDPILPASNTSSINVSSPGFYWVKVKSANNCILETSNRITPNFKTPPSIRLQGPSALCQYENIELDAFSNATILHWTFDGVAQPGLNNLTHVVFNYIAVGNHIVTATAISADGCSATATQIVSVVAAPDTPVIEMEVFCDGADPVIPYYHVKLSASSNVSSVFNWSNGSSGAYITVTNGGPYKVTVTNGGCSSSAQIDVPKNPKDFIWIFPTGCVTQCSSESSDPATLIGPRLPLPYWGWLQDGSIASAGHDTFPHPFALTTNGAYNLTYNTSECGITSGTLDYQLVACEKCLITRVDVKDIKKVEAKYCAFNLSLTIVSSYTSPITIAAPNGELIITPSSFMVNSGALTYNFVVYPVSGFAGGNVLMRVDGTLPNGQPCIYEFTIFIPSCIEGNINNRIMTNPLGATPQDLSVLLAPNPADSEVVVTYKNLPIGSNIELYDLTGRNIESYQTNEKTGNLSIKTASYPSGVYLVVVRLNESVLSQQKLIIK